jgi:tellurite resistance protein TerC
MIWLWIGFIALVFFLLALDLGVFNRKAHEVSAKEAMRWVAFFVSLGLLFAVAVYFIYEHNWMGIGTNFAQTMPHAAGAAPPHTPFQTPARIGEAIEHTAEKRSIGATAAMQYIAGWLTEYALSVDNIFVIAMIFSYFKVPAKYQHRVLFWGILGALIMRGIMIGAGVTLVQRFEWILYIFGAILIFTAIKMLRGSDEDFNPENSRTVRIVRRLIPLTNEYEGQRFFTRLKPVASNPAAAPGASLARAGRLAATPLFLVLLIVEVTDVVFAVDSIPAIIGITRDPFLVFTSNVFAIMGLRSLYFALASLMDKFHFLKYSLAAVLAFVGLKMMLEGVHHLPKLTKWLPDSLDGLVTWLPDHQIHLPTTVSLGFIIFALATGVVASLVYAKRHPEAQPAKLPPAPSH